MFDVVVVGSLNLDMVATTARLPAPGETVSGFTSAEYPGGKGLNQAVAAARAGARVAMIGCVGDDDAGRTLRRTVVDNGIDDSGVVTLADVATGRALISVDEAGENSIIVVPGANARLPDHLPVPASALLLTQLEIPLSTVGAVLRDAHRAGVRTVLNPAPAPATALDDALLAACSIVVPNEHEIDFLGGAPRLLASGVEHVVITRGGAGVDVIDRSSEFRHDAFPVAPVDTTGAGDAFCGALAARLAEGAPLDVAVRFASGAGALATTVPGAVPSLPHRADIDRLVASR